jgi:aryl-alcohol dehydrogenase-like predicted oxidoreductase
METRKIGSLDVTVVGMGCNNFGRRLDAEGTAIVVNASLDAGINFFDTADIYGNGESEAFLAKALGNRRREVMIATKFGNDMEGFGRGAHPDYIRKAVEASLKRLNTDVIDLYQQHVPDPDVPIAETLGALNDLVRAGKIREIGSSNFSAGQIREAEAAVKPGAARFVSVQNSYSLLNREPEQGVLQECERLGQAMIPYSPLGSGLLTGKFRQGQPKPEHARLNNPASAARWLTDANLALTEQLIQFAESRGHTILELAFGWLLAHPAVSSVIAGAMTAEQVQANVGAAGWKLTPDDMAAVDAILTQPV